jgi:hypothetical protein
MPEMRKLSSSFLSEAGYDPATQTLHVMIKGNLYQVQCSPAEAQAFDKADSQGSYYNANFRGRAKKAS